MTTPTEDAENEPDNLRIGGGYPVDTALICAIDDVRTMLNEHVGGRPDCVHCRISDHINAAFAEAVGEARTPAVSMDEIADTLKSADKALREYACHGGPGVPCIRTEGQCLADCGKSAGDALIAVDALLSRLTSDATMI